MNRSGIQRPIYLSGAPVPADMKTAVSDAGKKAAPFMGLVGATLLGATMAYFVPKVLDTLLLNYGRLSDADDSPTVDLDVEPRYD